MFTQLSRNWWLLVLRGIAAILFGILALAWHGTTLRSFMLLLGGFALVDGMLSIFAALSNVARSKRWWIVLQGSVSIAIAVCILIWTESAALILLKLVAAWALLSGILELLAARRLDHYVSNERLLRLSGSASILFALLVILLTKTAVLSVAMTIAISAILLGLLTLAFGLNIRSIGKLAHWMSQS